MNNFDPNPTPFSRYWARIGLMCLLVLGMAMPARASHILGGDISATNMGPQVYQITLRLYRDCAGITLPTTANVDLTNGPCGSAGTITMALNQTGNPFEVTSCIPGQTQCNGGSLPGIMVHTYTGIITLPNDTACTNWMVTYTNCCRSAAISNMSTPSSEGFTIETTFDEGVDNNTAVFVPVMAPFACINQNFTFSFHATDADGDSLTYEFVDALDAPGTPVTYASPYSANYPFQTVSGTVNLDLQGNLNFYTSMMQFPSVAIRVREWRNGNLVGESTRDLAIRMIQCSGTYCGDNILQGKVYADLDSNCVEGANDIDLGGFLVRVDPGPLYTLTQSDGSYQFNLASGNYTVTVPNGQHPFFSVLCPSTGHNVNFPTVQDTSAGNDFAMKYHNPCAAMSVDIGVGVVRPCSSNYWNVNWCNDDLDSAYNATVTINYDPNYTYISSTGNLVSQNGTELVFSLGDVAGGECGIFQVTASLPCDTALVGRTLCVEAMIEPNQLCETPDSNWDHSSVNITADCVNDSLTCFTIENTGTAAMAGPTDYRVYLNAQLWASGQIQLCGGCDTTLCFAGAGNTVRIEVDQRPGHPGNSHPTETVEACGSPNDTLGVYNMLPHDDADPWVSIFCPEVVLSYDPNYKVGYPTGTGNQKMITDGDLLQYVIHFQNTGNDTAFTVVVEDSLPAYLDLLTVQPGAASHPYSFNVTPSGKLQWTFSGIALPDDGTNEPASHGWLKFSVAQVPNNPIGTVIENKAEITFDINSPVSTNTEFHTVGEPVVVSQTDPVAITNYGKVSVWPNPFEEGLNFLVEELPAGTPVTVELYDLMGRKVALEQGRAGERIEMARMGLNSGVYLFRVHAGGQVISAGKLVAQ